MLNHPSHPSLVFHISPIYNLFHYLQTLTGRVLSESDASVPALQEITTLRNYSPGSGLWGYFEEAFAASGGIEDLEENLAAACQHLQAVLLRQAVEAMPSFEAEWRRRRGHLAQRCAELAAAWHPREKRLMETIEALFATPWEGPDAKQIDVHLLYDQIDIAKSRPLTIGICGQPLDTLLCGIVHELLHRNTFGAAKAGLWARLRLYYFTAGIPPALGNEITHAVITWAACAVSAQIWELDFQKICQVFYEGPSPCPRSLDVVAELWPAYQAGDMKPLAFIRQTSRGIRAATAAAPAPRKGD